MKSESDTTETVAKCIKSCEAFLPRETITEVRHFFEHDEIEMAFEGLLIDLMKGEQYPDGFDYEQWCKVILDLGLHEETNFVGDVWESFQSWAALYKPNQS